MVEHLTHDTKFKGLSPAITGTEREKDIEKQFVQNLPGQENTNYGDGSVPLASFVKDVNNIFF